jgi:hypothetical protein
MLKLFSAWRWVRFHRSSLTKQRMDTALIGDECDCDQNENDDEHHALFVLGEFENSEQAFHLGVMIGDRPFDQSICHVKRSAAMKCQA